MGKMVVTTGVIVTGVAPGMFANRETGRPGKAPEVEHIKPGTILDIEDMDLYKKWLKMRVIADYKPETGNPADRINRYFGAESPEAGRQSEVELQQAEEKAKREAEAARRIADAQAAARAAAAGQGGADGSDKSQSPETETPAAAKTETGKPTAKPGKSSKSGKSGAATDDDEDDAAGMV